MRLLTPTPLAQLALVLAASTSLAGCTLMPKARPEAGALPAQWSEAAARPAAPDPAAWWDAFADPTLKALTNEGVGENIPLQQAIFRVTRARATARETISRYLPTATGEVQTQYTRVLKGSPLVGSFQSFITGGGSGQIVTEQEQAFGSLGPSVSWEVPLFGLIQLSVKGARFNKQIAFEDVRAAQVAFVGDIADAYVDLRSAQNRKVILERSLENAEALAQVLEKTVASGYTAPGEAADARRQAEFTRARLPDAEIAAYVASSTISILRGKAPGAEDPAMAAALGIVTPVPTLPYDGAVAAPADLLRLRPDVARAEKQALLAAVAVGAARHELLPKLTITGNVGLADNLIGSPLPQQQGQLQVTPLMTVPLFDFGSRLAKARSEKAQFQSDLLAYKDTVNRAVGEADRAIVELDNAKRRLGASRAAENAAESFAVGARASQQAGIASLRDRLQAEQLLLDAQLSRVDAEAAQARASSAVYRAFAGALVPPTAQ